MIKLLIIDCDGTLTDGAMYYGEHGEVMKRFNTKDGMGIQLAKEAGIKCLILTGEESGTTKRRAKKLGVDIIEGSKDKYAGLLGYLEIYKICDLSEVAAIGDDINDLDLLQAVGDSACPKDAVPAVKRVVKYQCYSKGGQGCVREYIDLLIKRNEEDE